MEFQREVSNKFLSTNSSKTAGLRSTVCSYATLLPKWNVPWVLTKSGEKSSPKCKFAWTLHFFWDFLLVDQGLSRQSKCKKITVGIISDLHLGLKERCFWLIFRVLNHKVSKSGKPLTTEIGSDLGWIYIRFWRFSWLSLRLWMVFFTMSIF